jgi:uncharacterized protein YebE (UPF0316 family)
MKKWNEQVLNLGEKRFISLRALFSLMTFDYIGYILLPLLIFVARIVDVSIGTVRIIFVSKSMKKLSAILGFFEVLIWILAINKIMVHATNFIFYIAYAGGFSTGTFVGMMIEQKLSVGKVMVRIIAKENDFELISELKKLDNGLTVSEGEGKKGKVKIIFSIVNRKEVPRIKEVINRINPNSFYSIEDIRDSRDVLIDKKNRFFGLYRKGK